MKTVRRGGIYSRLFRSFLAMSLIPLLCLGAFTAVFAYQFSLNRVKKRLASGVASAAGELDAEIAKYEDGVVQFAASEEAAACLRGGAPDDSLVIRLNQKMYLIMAGRARFLEMQLVGTDGRIVHSTSGRVGISAGVRSDWGILRALRGQDGPVVYPGELGDSGRGLTIAVPVLDGDRVAGYAMLCISEGAIGQILSDCGSIPGITPRYMLTGTGQYLLFDDLTGSSAMFLPNEYRPALRKADGGAVPFSVGSDRQLLSSADLDGTGLRLSAAVSIELVESTNKELVALVTVICAIALLVCFVASHTLAEKIVRPIRVICGTIDRIESGDQEARVPELGEDEFGIMAGSFNHMLAQLNDQFRTNMERQNLLRVAEFKNLQAQISPHFLYNTLESIKYMARLGMNDEIDTVASKLSIILHSGMDFKREMIPLREEMKAVEGYVAIQQIRYEGKFTYSSDIPEPLLDCMVPNLIIQPLAENAVVHGLETKVGSGMLEIRGRLAGDDMFVEVYDDGAGISEDKIREIFSSEGAGEGRVGRESIGVINVHRRLQLYYGERYGLAIESVQGKFTRVSVHMPARKGGSDVVPSGDR